MSLWLTLFKQFFLDIAITHVTKGLRIFCLWFSILGGVNVHFTQEPSDPSYFNNGSDAKLVWDLMLIQKIKFDASPIVFW